MVILLISQGLAENTYIGLSTDTKPILYVNSGSTFYEVDTKNAFIFDPNDICPTTLTNWWPI